MDSLSYMYFSFSPGNIDTDQPVNVHSLIEALVATVAFNYILDIYYVLIPSHGYV